MREKTDEELKRIALQKNKTGCATREALEAQAILYHRVHPFGTRRKGCCPDYIPTGRNETEW